VTCGDGDLRVQEHRSAAERGHKPLKETTGSESVAVSGSVCGTVRREWSCHVGRRRGEEMNRLSFSGACREIIVVEAPVVQ